MCLNKPRLLMSQNIKNTDKHQFRGNFADFFRYKYCRIKKNIVTLHCIRENAFHNKFSLG